MHIRSMTRVVGALAAAALFGASAFAADYPVLRGSQIEDAPPAPNLSSGNWGGFYAGGSAGYGSSQFDAQKQSAQLADQAFHQLLVRPYGVDLIRLGKQSNDRTTFGGFVGFNSVFGDVVLGAELEYQRGNFRTSEIKTDARSFNNIIATTVPTTLGTEPVGTETVLGVGAKSVNKLEDFGVAKIRAGYAFGNFMPYLTIGAAIGRIRSDGQFVQVNATTERYDTYNVNATTDPNSGAVTYSRGLYTGRSSFVSDRGGTIAGTPKSGYVPGLAIGGGLDALLADNIFLRAEFQRIYFSEFKGVETIVDTAKVGAALKF
jgi:opacity protein-like surface antigen